MTTTKKGTLLTLLNGYDDNDNIIITDGDCMYKIEYVEGKSYQIVIKIKKVNNVGLN